MADKKSILEEALLDVKNIQSALNANTKEILRSVAREEIESVVKESLLSEVGFEEEDLESPEGETELGGDADAATSDISGDLGGEESELGLGDIEGSEEVAPVPAPEMGGMDTELGMGASALDGEEMDMTAASDDDVIAIYKKLSGEDEIEIVGDEIHMNISEPGEYIVKANDTPLGGEAASTEVPTDLVPVDGGEEGGEEGGVDYEIEMGDGTEGGEEPVPTDLVPADGGEEGGEEEEEEEEETEELTEAIPVGLAQSKRLPGRVDIGQPRGAGAEKLDESRKLVLETTKKYNTLLTEMKKLRAENEGYKGALKVFRNQLVETVVFNSNLTYTTRLFMEHSTTKKEKESIISRFDNEVSNLIESKKLYKAIVSELENRKPIKESVETKITTGITTGSSKQLNETTAYVDPSTRRIIELMNRVEKR